MKMENQELHEQVKCEYDHVEWSCRIFRQIARCKVAILTFMRVPERNAVQICAVFTELLALLQKKTLLLSLKWQKVPATS